MAGASIRLGGLTGITWQAVAIMRSLASFSLMVALLGLVAGSARADVVYAAGSGNEFGKLDLGTGAFTPIGTLSLPAGDNLFGMAPFKAGTLVGIDAVGEAYLIDVATARITDAGTSGITDLAGVGGAGGVVYANDFDPDGHLFALNFNGGSLSKVTVATLPALGDGLIAVGPDGFVYVAGITLGIGREDLFRVDPALGTFVDLGPTGLRNLGFTGVFIGSTLYAFDGLGDEYTLDTSTGAATLVGTPMLPNGDLVYAVAAAPVPEPRSLALFGVGWAIGLGVARGRRKQA
jgi:hypothetical protein